MALAMSKIKKIPQFNIGGHKFVLPKLACKLSCPDHTNLPAWFQPKMVGDYV